MMNNNGGGTSTVIARHDYLPFGEEISSGVGMRTMAQGYNVPDSNRQKYAMLERDSTGLDHTWWRKYESRAGRWTSPDPMRGSIGDPQSFDAYTYSANDPVNLIDPSGLMWSFPDASYGWDYFSAGFWGSGSLIDRPRHSGRTIIAATEFLFTSAWTSGRYHIWPDNFSRTLYLTTPLGDPQNSFAPLNQWWNPRWIKCPPVQFEITGIGPNQAPGTTAISQTARADIPDGGVAIKPTNFGVKGINGNNRSVFLNMRFSVDWTTATPANAPAGIPTQGPFFPVDNIGPASVRNSPGNMIDVYNYQSTADALASTRTVMVTTWIPENSAGVACPK